MNLPASSTVPAPSWSLPRRLFFRFGFLYALLYGVTVVTTQISGLDKLGDPLVALWRRPLVWLGHHVLGIAGVIATKENGSGDKLVDYLNLLLVASLALVGTLGWSVLARRRREHERLHALLRVYVRYLLAFVMLGYGICKVFEGQFSPPADYRLLQRYGDSSPMGLLWTFMGASPAYVVFSGAAETLGAALLLFRRTATLGALVLVGVLTNVVLLNFCYDVPVKINSTHYLVASVLLILPDLRRLLDVLLLNRATTPRPVTAPSPTRWRHVTRRVVKIAVCLLVVGFTVHDSLAPRPYRPPAPKTWYDGYWQVEAFTRNSKELADRPAEVGRWHRMRFVTHQGKVQARWRNTDESYGPLLDVTIPADGSTMIWSTAEADGAHPAKTYQVGYRRVDASHLELDGEIDGDHVEVKLTTLDPRRMLLVTRGFHWINEIPFNR